MAFVFRRALDRRTVLRGAAAGLALPWLDAMQPALARRPQPLRRALFVFAPNGVALDAWRPRGVGPDAEFGPTLAPLEPVRGRVTVFTGLEIDGGWAHGDGPGDHARAAASFLTCAHPRKTGGADLQAGVSIDQAIAAQLGGATPFPSLELGLERGAAAGICDSGYSCAYTSNISWRAPDTPVAKETEPRAVFTRLFGDPRAAHDRDAARRQRRLDRSVLDLVMADATALQQRLGAADRAKLDQYLDAVRELELRMQALDAIVEPAPAVPPLLDGGPAGHPERVALMYELIALAFATDRTRVATLMLGNGGSNRSYRFLEIPEGHHDLSHHGKDPHKLAAIARIDRFQIECLAAFLQRLAAAADGEADLLAHSLVLFGSGLGDGNRHNHDDLPVLLAGGGGGAARGRGHLRLPDKTPMAALYLAIWQAMGGDAVKFADSTAPLDLGGAGD